MVGPRCLVLSSSNIDQDIQDRMCFELQRRGTQPVKFRIPATPLMVPSLATVSEAVELFRRTGCRSIISIGTGSEADAGKAVRAMLEQQTATSSKSKVKLPHRAPVADSKGNTTVNAVTVPLICMATSISPVHSRGAYGLLHDEEHTVEMRHWRAPDVIATDFDVLSKGHYFSEDAVRCYLIANLFDLLFAVSCSSLSAAFDDSDFNSNYVTSRVEAFTSGESFHRVRGMITTAAGNSDPTDIKE